MLPAPLIVAAALGIASLAGAIHLAVDETPFAPGAAGLIAVGMMILALTAVAGVLLARSRWSRLAAAGVAAGWIAIAGSSSVSRWSVATIASAGLALAGSLGPWLARWLRHRASADGPPPAAVVALLLLLATPAAVGLVSAGGVALPGWVLAGWSVVLALSLARAMAGSLTAARVVHPVLSVAAGVTAGVAGGVVLGLLGLAVAGLAWRREVAISVAPRLTGGAQSALRIPPELAPPDVLDAAGADSTGRVRRP
ncbi:MAG: hypothetical protein WEE36_09705 [Acidimicrobiia bacterium]